MASNVKYNCIEQYAKNNSWKFKEYTNECVIWRGSDIKNYFSFNQNGDFRRFSNSVQTYSGTWVCDGDSNFILTTTSDMYYSSDGFKRRNKIDDPTSTETTPLNPIFSCVEKRMKESGNIVTKRTPSFIIFKMETSSWAFNKFGGWQQIKNGKIQYKGKWGCDGESEYKIVSDDGEIYESKDRPTKWKKSSSSDGSTKPTWKETTLTIEDLKNGRTVSMGMKGPVVGEIQKLLISAGYKDIIK